MENAKIYIPYSDNENPHVASLSEINCGHCTSNQQHACSQSPACRTKGSITARVLLCSLIAIFALSAFTSVHFICNHSLKNVTSSIGTEPWSMTGYEKVYCDGDETFSWKQENASSECMNVEATKSIDWSAVKGEWGVCVYTGTTCTGKSMRITETGCHSTSLLGVKRLQIRAGNVACAS